MVYLAAVVSPTSNDLLPSLMAVKSAPFYKSRCLAKEERLLSDFADCPHIIRCFGEDLTIEEDGEQWYNMLLEHAAGGSLADRIQSFGRGLPESEVRRFTKSLLMGISYIHKKGYVHCDIKPHNNMLLVEEKDDFSMSLNGKRKRVQESTAKIADFGLAKRAGKKLKAKENKPRLRGTALYMAPESILRGEYEPHADIWTVGSGAQYYKC
ncbi:mitogen-activated protein kinase kinase kinase 17-like [Camellia sinensis]|uniref:mitogen-activated protein kinase kinase kinase 17-like n=1 Tax=Camellia sinensis TaxID=4442 RepID=UPI0010368907|nr:mitogen-activated protein kinase kinase kinase 17-like [Camellia sinensis]